MKEVDQLTLEIDGPKITAVKFRKGINAFLDVIDEVVKTFSGSNKDVNWIVSVSEGSTKLHLRPEVASSSLPADRLPELLRVIQRGFRIIANGSEIPPYFNEKALKRAKALANTMNGEIDTITVRWKDQLSLITPAVSANVGTLFRTAHKSWGSVEGRLRIITEVGGYKFFIFDDVVEKEIRCHFQSDLLESALKSFGKRIIVSGLISYRPDGAINGVEVEVFREFRNSSNLPSADEVYGILSSIE
jgi:hypothetical protein